jgi:hypothetical protein
VNGSGRHLDLLNGGRRQLALLNGRRWGLPRFNGRRWGLARLREGCRVPKTVLNSGQWRRRRRVCVNGGQSSVWHGSPRRLALKPGRLAFPAVHGQLLSAGGHGSPRPRRTAAPAGNEASRAPPRGETEGASGFGAIQGTKGWGAGGFFAKKPMRLNGWRAVLCKMAGAQSVAFRWRSGAPDLSFHSLHRWGGFHLIRSLHRYI